ncbi:MAG: cell envelope integrity protein CreD [Lysobacteraceae bacterium]
MRTGLKLLMIGGLLIVLMIPILSLRGLVWERQERGREAAEDIARSSSRAQTLIGPLLLLDSEETLRRSREIRRESGNENVVEEVKLRRQIVVPAEMLELDNTLATRERRRGLFAVPLYLDELTATARFTMPEAPPSEGERIAQRWVGAALVFGLGDARGIQSFTVSVDGTQQRVEPGSPLAWLGDSVQVPLDAASLHSGRAIDVRLAARIQGTQALNFAPLAGEARVAVQADWAHPGFQGQRLPDDPASGDAGFKANWTLSRLSGQAVHMLPQCRADTASCAAVEAAQFGVKLVDPVDLYLKTDRAMKYALLFLVLVFGAVFFVEALRSVQVHPLQYGLTGLALATFFLLLLSLSEHLGFGSAYLLAALACVALVTTYMQAVLGSRGRGLAFGALLAALYGLLYGLLQSEDYALLMGSLALFGLLAVVMLATRRLDWRRLGTARTEVA